MARASRTRRKDVNGNRFWSDELAGSHREQRVRAVAAPLRRARCHANTATQRRGYKPAKRARGLRVGARRHDAAGEDQIVPLLEQNLKEDAAMASWLDMNVAAITRDYLSNTTTAAATS